MLSQELMTVQVRMWAYQSRTSGRSAMEATRILLWQVMGARITTTRGTRRAAQYWLYISSARSRPVTGRPKMLWHSE